MKAVELLRELNKTGARKLPDDAPRGFIRPRWERHVFTSEGIDRRFYETCVLSELGKSLRAGDLSVTGSRRYRDFDDYLLPAQTFAAMRTAGLPLAIELDAENYLSQRSELLHAEFLRVDRLAQAKELPDASVTDGVLKITPLDNQESEEAELLTRQAYGLTATRSRSPTCSPRWIAGATSGGTSPISAPATRCRIGRCCSPPSWPMASISG